MPIVSDALTEAEWLAIEHEHNVKPKGIAQLGKEGHWLIDDASAEDRAKVLGLVPAVPRFVLLHGYGRSYRRRRDACWRPSAACASSAEARPQRGRRGRRARRGVGRRHRRHPRRRVEPRVPRMLVPRRRHPRRARCEVPGPQPAGHLPLGSRVRGAQHRGPRAGVANGADDVLPRQHRVAHPRDTHRRRHPPRAELRRGPRPEGPRHRSTRRSFPPIAIAPPHSPTTSAASASSPARRRPSGPRPSPDGSDAPWRRSGSWSRFRSL